MTQPHEMLIAAAKAMAASNRQLWEALSEQSQSTYLRCARAALLAIRDLDGQAIEAAEAAIDAASVYSPCPPASVAHTAIINHILGE